MGLVGRALGGWCSQQPCQALSTTSTNLVGTWSPENATRARCACVRLSEQRSRCSDHHPACQRLRDPALYLPCLTQGDGPVPAACRLCCWPGGWTTRTWAGWCAARARPSAGQLGSGGGSTPSSAENPYRQATVTFYSSSSPCQGNQGPWRAQQRIARSHVVGCKHVSSSMLTDGAVDRGTLLH
jgi:hypothetical protein